MNWWKEREMGRNHNTASLVAAVMGVFLLAPIQPPIASADVKATANNSLLSISTGTIAVFATDSYTATNPFSALTTSVVNGRAKVFYIRNTGNFGLSRFTVTLTLPAGTAIANFRRCPISVDFSANDVCATGGYTSLSISANSATSIALNLPPGSFYAFQIRQNKNTNMNVSVSANSAFINTSGTANS
jgi:hypothetical protein